MMSASVSPPVPPVPRPPRPTGAEQELLRAIREVCATEVAPRAARVDADAVFPEESYQALARRGLAGLLVPEELGGTASSTVAYALAMEEITAACGSTSTVYMTQMHCAHPILLAGTQEQREAFVPGLARGELYGAIAITEPSAGSDASSLRTTARSVDGGYAIDGQKTFISTGDRAGVVLVFAAMRDRGAGREGVTAFLVEQGTPGLSAGPPMHKMGQKGASTVELFLEDCRVPEHRRLGPEGAGHEILIRAVIRSRISAAAQGVGFARAAFDAAARWAHDRGLLAASRRDAQDVQFSLAEMRARIDAARALLLQTCARVDGGEGDAVSEVAAAKLHCTDVGMSVAQEAMDVMGEDGDLAELGVERAFRDVKVTQIYDGTNQVQRMLLARAVRASLEER
jgi:alkylation response protein AidB-like acyl-CoA dehydrogenase